MAETAEHKVKRVIRAILAEHHAYYTMPTTAGYGRSGALDFEGCAYSRFIGIEAKSIHSKYGERGPTDLQLTSMNEILSSGGIALCINETNYDLLQGVLHDIAHGQFDRARDASLGAYRELERERATRLQDSSGVPAPVLRRRR